MEAIRAIAVKHVVQFALVQDTPCSKFGYSSHRHAQWAARCDPAHAIKTTARPWETCEQG